MADATIDYNDPIHMRTWGWPKEWPQLTAKNINKGRFYARRRGGDENCNCACLMGWARNVSRDWTVVHKIDARIYQLIEDQYGVVTFAALWNDDPDVSKTKIAKLWNAVGESFEYVKD